MLTNCDTVIIGAGIYGLYAAGKMCGAGRDVVIIDADNEPFQRGSYVNQARLHNGYHYPRSLATAQKSAKYFHRFLEDFGDCINTDFQQVYAVAKNYSWANARQFEKFCRNLGVLCEPIDTEKYFNPITVEQAYLTHEYSFDAKLICSKLMASIGSKAATSFGVPIESIARRGEFYEILMENGNIYKTRTILNATYAGVNQIHGLLGFEPLNIKYELCEVILCAVSEHIKNVGLTVMDGPFFSVMPFGKSGYHSITTVSRTPHMTSYEITPQFACQAFNPKCTGQHTDNCNQCAHQPDTAFHEMNQIAKKYMNPTLRVSYISSLFSLKPILKSSEIDDSRPTLVRQYSEAPTFYTVFSGKINTMYDLDVIL